MIYAGVAQLVAQLICNHQVGSSNLSAGTILKTSIIKDSIYEKTINN
jgi:hypothetical protein